MELNENTRTTITVEFPLEEQMVELDTQHLFEIIRQQIALSMNVNPEDVWIKSVSAITNYDMGKEITGQA